MDYLEQSELLTLKLVVSLLNAQLNAHRGSEKAVLTSASWYGRKDTSCSTTACRFDLAEAQGCSNSSLVTYFKELKTF